MVTFTFTPAAIRKRLLALDREALHGNPTPEYLAAIDDRLRWLALCCDKKLTMSEIDLRNWGL